MRPRSLLDGFFSNDVAAITRALDVIKDPRADAADQSHGRVTQRDTFGSRGRFAMGSVLCPRIFGPVDPLTCVCGATTGEAARDVVCPKCGVICGDPELREWRFGHLEIAGAVHPLLFDAVAAALDLSRAELERLLLPPLDGDDDELLDRDPIEPGFETVDARLLASGAHALRRAAIIRVVPVPPPGDRPLVKDLAPTMRTPWIGPVNEAWQPLITRSVRQLRLVELNAPPIILANEAMMLQRALADVVHATVTPPPSIPRPWYEPSARRLACTGALVLPETWRSSWDPDREVRAPSGIRALFFLDGGALLVQRAHDTLVVRDGALIARHASCLRAARSQHGTRVVCERAFVDDLPAEVGTVVLQPESDDPDVDTPDPVPATALAVLDVISGAYATTFPDDLAALEAEKGEPEDLWLRDARTGVQLACPFAGNDRPQLLGWTRDARFAWLGSEDDGGVIDAETGIPQVIPERRDTDDATPVIEFGARGDDEYTEATALALTSSCEWRFAGAGEDDDGNACLVVVDESRVLLRVSGAVVCAAFAADASLLAAAIGDDVVIVDVNTRRIAWRFRAP